MIADYLILFSLSIIVLFFMAIGCYSWPLGVRTIFPEFFQRPTNRPSVVGRILRTLQETPLRTYLRYGIQAGVVVGVSSILLLSWHDSTLPLSKLQRFLSYQSSSSGEYSRMPSFHFALPSILDDFLARFYFRHLLQQMRDMGMGLTYKFYLSTFNSTADDILNSLVMQEASTYDDMVMFDTLIEDYHSLPQKTRYMFHTAAKQTNFDYLVKMDTDLCARPADFALALLSNFKPIEESDRTKRLIWAGKFVNGTRYRDSYHPWFIPNDVWPLDRDIPSYAAGGLYVLSHQLAKLLGDERDDPQVIASTVEDASIGISTAKMPPTTQQRIERVHLLLFDVTGLPPRDWICGRHDAERASASNYENSPPAAHFTSLLYPSIHQLCMQGQERLCPHKRPGVLGLYYWFMELVENFV